MKAIQEADSLMGYLVHQMQAKGLWGNTNLIIVSDHGMANVSRERLIVLDDYINIEDVEIISFSPVMMMNAKPGKREEVYNALKKGEDHYRIYKKEELPERYHLKNHYRVPELIMIADLGWTINNRAYIERRENYPSGGTHGFDNQEPEMHALFVANGPDFKEGFRMGTFENIHIYELMAHLLRIPSAGTDGSLDSLRAILR